MGALWPDGSPNWRLAADRAEGLLTSRLLKGREPDAQRPYLPARLPDRQSADGGRGARGRAARPIELTVASATDAPRGVFHSRLVMPAAPGELTLAYPKWVQGEHAPSGPVTQVAGFRVLAAGKALAWRRDPLDVFLVRVEVPAGAREVEVDFDYLSPPSRSTASATARRRTPRRTC